MLVSASRGGGVSAPRGCVPGPGGGVCSQGGAWSGGGVPGTEGVCLVWGGLLPGGSGIPACTEADTLPPCGQNHKRL